MEELGPQARAALLDLLRHRRSRVLAAGDHTDVIAGAAVVITTRTGQAHTIVEVQQAVVEEAMVMHTLEVVVLPAVGMEVACPAAREGWVDCPVVQEGGNPQRQQQRNRKEFQVSHRDISSQWATRLNLARLHLAHVEFLSICIIWISLTEHGVLATGLGFRELAQQYILSDI